MVKNGLERIVISIGGSLIVPNGGINTKFLSELNSFIRTQLATTKRQFFLVSGGGMTARHYRDAAQSVLHHEIPDIDIDWLGVHATRMNGHLLRTIFYDIAHPRLIENYDHKLTNDDLAYRLIIGAGWKPGFSSDFDAVQLCEDYDVNTIINMSNIEKAYDKDPKKFPDAKPLDHISWKEFRIIVGDEWKPGMNVPFDPIASKKADGLNLTVVIMNGNFQNLENYLQGKEYVGSVIQ